MEKLTWRPLIVLVFIAAALCLWIGFSVGVSDKPLLAAADDPPPTLFNPSTDSFPGNGTYVPYDPAEDGALATPAAGSAESLLDPNQPCGSLQACIKNVVIIMMENQSFDRFFGVGYGQNSLGNTVDGIPTDASGQQQACLPDPRLTAVTSPLLTPVQCSYHVPIGDAAYPTAQDNPHPASAGATDVAGLPPTYWPGKTGQTPIPMTGFLSAAWTQCTGTDVMSYLYATANPACSTTPPAGSATWPAWDVMRYYTASDLPNYYYYAQWYALQDHMFEPVNSYSMPSHLYLVSNWAATCAIQDTPVPATPWAGLINNGYCQDNGANPDALQNYTKGATPFELMPN